MADQINYSFTKLVVADLEAMARYYDTVFGFKEIHRVQADIDGRPIEEILLGTDGSYGGLVLLTWPGSPPPGAGEVILGFTTADIGGVFDRAVAAGGTVVEAPHETEAAPGFLVGFVTDPEGHLAEVVQAAG